MRKNNNEKWNEWMNEMNINYKNVKSKGKQVNYKVQY